MRTVAGAGRLLQNVAAFGQALRSAGLEAGPQRLQTAVRGLAAMGFDSRDTVYWTLYCAFVSRREEAAAFNAVFAAFWDRLLPVSTSEEALPVALEPHAAESPDGSGWPSRAVSEPAHAPDELEVRAEPQGGTAWSARERLRELDFTLYGSAELEEARAYLNEIRRHTPRRRSRRFRAAPAGRDMDRRRTMRSAMRTEGHPVQRAWRQPRLVARRLIFLIDVSGSMEAHARPLVLFAGVVVRAAPRVEVFTFGTRLTRITGELTDRDIGRALLRASRAIPDWAGGTRIGDNLKAFNETARWRALTRGAVVVIFSDGCERGDAQTLAGEAARLGRAAHTLVWVNPLGGDPRYEPRTQGMLATLPSIDVLLPGHNLAALESLTEVLDAIPARRGTGDKRR